MDHLNLTLISYHLKVSKFGSIVCIKCMASYSKYNCCTRYLSSIQNTFHFWFYTLHSGVALSDEITRKLSNQACFAGCAESNVWFAFRTLQQNGGYVEYSCCSDIILRQVSMFSDQSINQSITLFKKQWYLTKGKSLY